MITLLTYQLESTLVNILQTTFISSDENHNQDNLSFVFYDLIYIDPIDFEEMDILHQVALLSVRANKFYKKTDRSYPGLDGRSRVGLDKSKIKCFKCNQLGYFARERRSPRWAPIITYPNRRPQANQTHFYQNTQNTPTSSVQNIAHFASPAPV
ncbi:putative transcription factor interactor and regulator CCHC(Zn) family [Helianthus anomalus]